VDIKQAWEAKADGVKDEHNRARLRDSLKENRNRARRS